MEKEETKVYPYQIMDIEDLPNEIWRDVEGYEGLYAVSNLGRVKSLDRTVTHRNGAKHQYNTMILKQYFNIEDYLRVGLYKNGKMKNFSVHKLVAKAFLEDYNENLETNHLDEVKVNNCVSNLNMMTRKENNNWGTRNLRASKAQTNDPNKSKQVAQYDLQGTLIAIYPSTAECGRNGYNHGDISNCCRGVYKTHKGYIWQYI